MTISDVWAVTRNEWRRLKHTKIPVLLLMILISLWVIAIFSAHHRWQEHARHVEEVTQQSQKDWHSQPDRHPHRVAHYGDFVAKPLHPLSIIEPGIIEQSGYLVYLEAHRLNSANFNPATEATSLGRFPIITPSMIVEWWMPLFLIMVGYHCITSEKISGALAYMRGNGTSAWTIATGKYLALFIPLLTLLLIQAMFTLVWIGGSPIESHDQTLLRLFSMLIGQIIYIAGWCLLVVLVSWQSRQLHSALLTLLLCWVCICIIFPKGLANFAQITYPTQARTEAEYHAELKLKKIGDSHNPDDPYFAAFKARILKQYGVSNTEDLPINYNGLLMQEGERLTTQVYREQQALHDKQLAKQNAMIRHWLWLSPALALQYLQMASSGNDITHHQAFIKQAEHRRYQLIQYLNQIHTHKVHQHDDKNTRVSADFWAKAPRPTINLAPLSVSKNSIVSALLVLAAWLLVPLLLLKRVIQDI